MYPGNFSRLAIGSNSATRVCTETEPRDAGDLFAPAVGGHGMGWARGCVSSSPAQLLALGTSLPAIGPKELWARPSRGISSGRWTTPHAAPPSRTAQYPRRPIIGGRRDGTEPIRAARPSLSLRPRADRDGTSRLSRHCRHHPAHPASAAHGRHMDARALAPCRHVTPWCRPAGPWAVQASATCAQQRDRVRDCQRRSATGTLPSRPVQSPARSCWILLLPCHSPPGGPASRRSQRGRERPTVNAPDC
jgi:hypothetical protein